MPQVLLIEPDKLLGESYRSALNRAGYKVSVSLSAQSAITLADESRPDMIVLELQLIEHNGIEFLYEFRSYVDWQQIPIIVISHVPASEFMDAYPSLFEELGIRAYLYKPQTSLRTLIHTVHRINANAAEL